jgi:hypothetical protein
MAMTFLPAAPVAQRDRTTTKTARTATQLCKKETLKMAFAILANDRQMAAIIAGLRLIERELPRGEFLPHGVSEILDAGETIQPLNESEIDDLCDCLAMTDPRFVIAEHTDEGILFFGSDGWGDVSTATQYSFEEMLSAHLPVGNDPRWVPLSDLATPPYQSVFCDRTQIEALGAAAQFGPASHQFQRLSETLGHTGATA